MWSKERDKRKKLESHSILTQLPPVLCLHLSGPQSLNCLPVPPRHSWALGTAEKGRWSLGSSWRQCCDITASRPLRMLRCFIVFCCPPSPPVAETLVLAEPRRAMLGHVNTFHTILTHHTTWFMSQDDTSLHKIRVCKSFRILCHNGQCHFLDRLQTTGGRNKMNCYIKNLFSAKFCGQTKTISKESNGTSLRVSHLLVKV